jgi:hypothetical protein
MIMKTKTKAIEYDIFLRKPHPIQKQIWDSTAKRKVIRAGRRGGKTVIAATICVDKFLHGFRPLYAAPSSGQLDTWWFEVKRALAELTDAGIYKKNETEHSIERVGTKNRIKGKTAWFANMLRGDYSDFLVLDEFQLMNEETWEIVGAPMLLDNDGDAMFIYTPFSLHSKSITKARDPLYASKLFKKAKEDKSGRWAAFHFKSHDNPHISMAALNEIASDMSDISYRQEILAEDIDEAPGALWSRDIINQTRVMKYPDLVHIVVGVDPTGSQKNECGIVVAGLGSDGHGYVIDDKSLLGTPGEWADAVIDAYDSNNADIIVGEMNYGGEMVEATIEQAAKTKNQIYRYKNVHATRGKVVRAEPVVAAYEHGRVHNVGDFPHLENEMVMWIPGISSFSPNRIDALVWAITELNLKRELPQQTPTYYIPDLSHTPTRGRHS